MNRKMTDYPSLIKEIRRQLGLSQEDLARRLGVSLAADNRWENRMSKLSKLAKARLEAFSEKMTKQGSLKLPARFMLRNSS